MTSQQEAKILHHPCYKTNNRYAYKYDLNGKPDMKELKIYNFVPTYDKWCLYCDKKDCKLRCSKCKYVYYCSKECQIKAHAIHKKHCSRDLFTICITCGLTDCTLSELSPRAKDTIKCQKCPVKYCSKKCYDVLHKPHEDIDCDIFSLNKV